jgi:hypothetical protein
MTCKSLVFVALIAALPLATAAEDATLHREKSFPAKPGGTVKVEASFHDVIVSVRPGETVDVTVDVKASGWPNGQQEFVKSCEPEFTQTGDTLVIRSKPKSRFSFGWQSLDARIEVRMPPGMALDAYSGSGHCSLKGDTGASARFHTGSGDIAVEGSCTSLDTSSGSGSVIAKLSGEADRAVLGAGSGDLEFSGEVRELTMATGSGDATARLSGKAAKVKLNSGSGDLFITGGAGELGAKSGSGSITAEGLSGGARIETGSGDVRAKWDESPKGGQIGASSSSGSVSLTFPKDAQFTGLIDTSSGDIRCDFPGTLKGRDNRRFSLAGPAGSTDLQVETSSGDIQVIAAR